MFGEQSNRNLIEGASIASCRRIALFAASVVVLLFGASSASAATVNLTNWSPAISNSSRAGQFHTLATNPENGRQLIFGYIRPSGGDGNLPPTLFARVFTADGTPVAGTQTLLEAFELSVGNQGYDAAYNPVTGGWVVSYLGASLEVAVRFLNADGSPAGPPIVLNTFIPDNAYVSGSGTSIAYDSKDERFLVGWTYYAEDGQPVGRFVSADGTVQGAAEFGLMSDPDALEWADYRQIALAYSPAQDGFGLTTLASPLSDGTDRPWFQRLDPDGRPVGAQQVLVSNDSDASNPDIAYNPARDEYGVVWVDQDGSLVPLNPALIQRLDASSGSLVGSASTQSPTPSIPVGSQTSPYRAHITAHPTADRYFVAAWGDYPLESAETVNAVNAWEVAGDGTQDLSTLEWIISPPSAYNARRPAVAFSVYDCSYAVTAIGREVSGSEANVYGTRVQAESPCVAPIPLTVTKSGTGSGTVTSSPEGIDCGDSCTGEFQDGETVSLTATPASGSTFSGWTGACSGTGACEVEMTEERSVDAEFTSAAQPALVVAIESPKKVRAGRNFTVRIEVANQVGAGARSTPRAGPASSLRSCLTLPTPVLLVKAQGAKVTGRTACWSRSSLGAGQSVAYEARLRARRATSALRASARLRVSVTASGGSGTPVSVSGGATIRILRASPPKPQPPTG